MKKSGPFRLVHSLCIIKVGKTKVKTASVKQNAASLIVYLPQSTSVTRLVTFRQQFTVKIYIAKFDFTV